MSQYGQDNAVAVTPQFTNVAEAWMLYDTILIGGYYATVKPNNGYFQAYATLGANAEVAFFNVRNRSHGIPYNNQDARDQLPYVFHIYAIGVAWFAPSTSCYHASEPPLGQESLVNALWQTEIPKHTSVVLKTNQDEVLITNSLMVPPGYGPVGGGVAQGEVESAYGIPAVHHTANSQGGSILTNVWGFRKPKQIPRTANLSVVLRFNTYAQNLLQTFSGPNAQPIKSSADDTTNFNAPGCGGIQVFLKGKREVQQRGQYHR